MFKSVMWPIYDPQVVLNIADGARHKLKICPELSGNEVFDLFLKILYVVCKAMENVQVLNFWRMMKLSFTWRQCQCEKEFEGHIWD